MANTISLIGKIMLGKDSDRFHPVDRKTFASSWTNTTVKFNCISDTNRVMCTVQGGRWQSDAKNAYSLKHGEQLSRVRPAPPNASR